MSYFSGGRGLVRRPPSVPRRQCLLGPVWSGVDILKLFSTETWDKQGLLFLARVFVFVLHWWMRSILGKACLGQTLLTYFYDSIVTKKKSFITLAPGRPWWAMQQTGRQDDWARNGARTGAVSQGTNFSCNGIMSTFVFLN
jgi:hypothetical protein